MRIVRVQIDAEACQGHGRCYDLAPEVFGEDEDGYAVLLCDGGQVPAEHQDVARLAVANCGEGALTVDEVA
jgi:ferredoxin